MEEEEGEYNKLYIPYFLEYRAERLFSSREFDPVLKRGRRLNGAGIYNKINVRYCRILLGSTPNSLAAASFDFFSAVSTAFSLKKKSSTTCALTWLVDTREITKLNNPRAQCATPPTS